MWICKNCGEPVMGVFKIAGKLPVNKEGEFYPQAISDMEDISKDIFEDHYECSCCATIAKKELSSIAYWDGE